MTMRSNLRISNDTYDKYGESDQFIYDEQGSGKSSFIKQDLELYNEEEAAIPGASVRVKRVDSDWKIYVNGNEKLSLIGSEIFNFETIKESCIKRYKAELNSNPEEWTSIKDIPQLDVFTLLGKLEKVKK